MPDNREHRGPHPKDAELFAPHALPTLRQAARDLSYLLTGGYNPQSALKLVGDHFQLDKRQRVALGRGTCSDAARASRRHKQRSLSQLAGRHIAIDGFNCLITVEAALSGGVLLRSRDGAHRDLASVHGTYKRVSETGRAIEMLRDALSVALPASVCWYLDSPVSNSGRLRELLSRAFEAAGLDWQVELVPNADREVIGPERVIASSDAWILDASEAWVDLPGALIGAELSEAWLVDLRDEHGEGAEKRD